MPFDTRLVERVRHLLTHRLDIQEKKMFGGLVFLLAGNILVGIMRESLIARLGIDEAEAALRDPNAHVFDITGKPMRGWVTIDPSGLEEDEQLASWVRLAEQFVVTLPVKES